MIVARRAATVQERQHGGRAGGGAGVADRDRPDRPTMPAPGGAMGWPFRRRADESLRIQPVGDELHIVWRIGETALAHLVTLDQDEARALYAWLGLRFGSAAERAARLGAEPGEKVVRRLRCRGRQLAVLAAGERGHKVVDVVDGVVRSAMRCASAAEAAELFAILRQRP
jgi:hypothetical protein